MLKNNSFSIFLELDSFTEHAPEIDTTEGCAVPVLLWKKANKEKPALPEFTAKEGINVSTMNQLLLIICFYSYLLM